MGDSKTKTNSATSLIVTRWPVKPLYACVEASASAEGNERVVLKVVYRCPFKTISARMKHALMKKLNKSQQIN
jgi:hypothetical protein